MDYVSYEVARKFCHLNLAILSVRFYREGDPNHKHLHKYKSDCYPINDEEDSAGCIVSYKPMDWNHFDLINSVFSAPTFEEVQAALRLHAKMMISIAPYQYNALNRSFYYKFIIGIGDSIMISDEMYETSEEALNAVCNYAISLKEAHDRRTLEDKGES